VRAATKSISVAFVSTLNEIFSSIAVTSARKIINLSSLNDFVIFSKIGKD